MKHAWMSVIVATVASVTALAPVRADGLPEAIGNCTNTSIKAVGTRLAQDPGSGSLVFFENGSYQVSYGTVVGIDRSKPGDPVRMCLVYIPTECPKHDNRGREYRTTNLRTHEQWTLPNSSHSCGGA